MRPMALSHCVRIAVLSGVVTTGAAGCSKGLPPGPDTQPATAPLSTPPEKADVKTSTAAPAADAGPVAADAAPADAAAAAEVSNAACESGEVAGALKALKPDFATVSKRGLEVCGGVGDDKRGCIVVDVESGKRSFAPLAADDADHIPPWPEHFDDGLVRDDKRPVLKQCVSAADGCKDLYVGTVTTAHLSADKTHAVLTTVGSDPAKSARVFDTATREPGAVIALPGSELVDCSFAAFVGPSLVVSVGPCGPGQAKTWLAKADSGEKIADVAPKAGDAFALREGQWAALPSVGPNVFAFRAAQGGMVVVQDVVTGEVKTTVAIATEGVHDVNAPGWIFAYKSGFVMTESLPLPTSLTFVDLSNPSSAKIETRSPVICP